MLMFCAGKHGLHVTYMTGWGQQVINPDAVVPMSRWTTVRVTIDAVQQTMTVRYTGAVARQEACGIAIGTQENAQGINMWMSDPWHQPARAAVRNVIIEQFAGLPVPIKPPVMYRSNARLLQMGTILGVVDLPTSYELTFDIFPSKIENWEWRSIIHLTTFSNYHQGGRMPGIWFCHVHGCNPEVRLSLIWLSCTYSLTL